MLLLNEYSPKFTDLGLRMAENALYQLACVGLIAEDKYPMYDSKKSTVVVMNYSSKENNEDRVTAAVALGIELDTICEILGIPLWQGGFDWDHYVINKSNPGSEVGKVLSRHTKKRKLTMANLGIPDYMIARLDANSQNIPKVVEALDFSFLTEFAGQFAVCWTMSGEIHDKLSHDNSWSANSRKRRVVIVDLK